MRFLFLSPLLIVSVLALASCSGKRLPENCYLQPESGKCRASILRWYVDERTGTCKAFVWGGCEGVVPFETQQECAAQCMADQPAAVPVIPAGKNPPVPTAQQPAGEPAAVAPAAATATTP